jgi:co-chaperonin GroES (HSP10)
MGKKILGKKALEAQDVTQLVPWGDRVLIEEVEVEDCAYFGDIKIPIQRAQPAKSPRDPNPNIEGAELIEIERGWILGQVIAVGNGHRLENNDVVPMPHVGACFFIERLTGRKQEFAHRKYRIISQVDLLEEAPGIQHLIEDEEEVAV